MTKEYKCCNCGSAVNEQDGKLADENGQDVFCDQYCFEVWNGTPFPISKGALVFDKFWNQNEIPNDPNRT